MGGSDAWLAKPIADLASPICRCEDEPHPSHAIVRACSRVASRNGAAGYKVMRLIARAPWTSTPDLLNAFHTTKEPKKSRVVYTSTLRGPVIIQSAAVLEAVKARPGNGGVRRYGPATAGRDSFCARRRRKSAVGAEESLRRGRTKERRSDQESKKASEKLLALVAAIRELAARVEPKNEPKKPAVRTAGVCRTCRVARGHHHVWG